MRNLKLQNAIESTCAATAVLHEAQALRCQHGFWFPRCIAWHTLHKLQKQRLLPQQTMYMSQLHTAQEARQQHSSTDTKRRGQRQQHRQAAATSRHKPQRRSSNIPRDAPSQAASAPKLTPLQRWLSTRHLKTKQIRHMSANRHISTHICLQQYDSSACEFCVCSVIK